LWCCVSFTLPRFSLLRGPLLLSYELGGWVVGVVVIFVVFVGLCLAFRPFCFLKRRLLLLVSMVSHQYLPPTYICLLHATAILPSNRLCLFLILLIAVLGVELCEPRPADVESVSSLSL
jgi:hypothetical protein